MKKIICFIIIILLCGCSKEINCNLNDEYITTVLINYNNKKVKNISAKLTFKTNEEAENYCTLLKLSEINLEFECKENTVIIKDYKGYMQINSNDLDSVITELTNQRFICE